MAEAEEVAEAEDVAEAEAVANSASMGEQIKPELGDAPEKGQ